MLGRAEAALELAEEARGMLSDGMDLGEIITVEWTHAYWLLVAGRLPRALEAFDRIVELSGGDPQVGRELVGYSPLIWAEMVAAWMLAQAGRFDECWPRAERAIRMAREHGAQEEPRMGPREPQLLRVSRPRHFPGARHGRSPGSSGGGGHCRGGRQPVLADHGLIQPRDRLFPERRLRRQRRTFHRGLGARRVARERRSTGRATTSRCSPTRVWRAVTPRLRSPRHAKGSQSRMPAGPGFKLPSPAPCWSTPSSAPTRRSTRSQPSIAEARELVRKSGGNSLLPRLREAEARLAGRNDRTILQAGLREAEAMYRAMGAPDPADRLTRELAA